MVLRSCRSFLQQLVPKSSGDRVLRKTRICRQRIAEIKVPAGTRIRVNNNKHGLVPSPQEMMTNCCETFLHQEFTYDLADFNSEHFATFVRYGRAVCTQVSPPAPGGKRLCGVVTRRYNIHYRSKVWGHPDNFVHVFHEKSHFCLSNEYKM